MAEADAEGREQDGAQELQAPAAARAQAHLGSDPRPLLCSLALRVRGMGNGRGYFFTSSGRNWNEVHRGTTRYRLIACKLGRSINDSFTCQVEV